MSVSWKVFAAAALLMASRGFAQEIPSATDVKPGPGGNPTGNALTTDPALPPGVADTVPSLEKQSDIPASPNVSSVPSEGVPAANDPAAQTEPIPNAIERQATPNNANSTPANPEGWRYRWHNGRWWYYMPDKSWRIWDGGQWMTQTDFTARYSTQYTGPRFRGYSQPYYSNGQYYDGRYYDGRFNDGYYDGRYSTGYRGYYNQPYYNGNRGNYYYPPNDPRNYGPGYGYGPGNRYYSPYSDGSPRGNVGAGVGGAIGGAIGGNQGGNIGAAVGGAIGSRPR